MTWIARRTAELFLAMVAVGPGTDVGVPGDAPTSMVAVPSTSAPATTLAPLWAGHQVTTGTREVPFLGTIETRMDSFVIARAKRDGDVITLEQTACHVRFAKVAGAMVHLDAGALPTTRTLLAPNPETGSLMGGSLVAWSSEDIDDDGNPGMTVHVQAPVCNGDLYVANRSRTRATATVRADRIEGHASVRVHQEILGARGACLSAMAESTDERQSGPFAFVPVAEGTTCDDLIRQGWPVTAR